MMMATKTITTVSDSLDLQYVNISYTCLLVCMSASNGWCGKRETVWRTLSTDGLSTGSVCVYTTDEYAKVKGSNFVLDDSVRCP